MSLPDDVGAQAQHLAELDGSRAQFCQRTPETLAVRRADVLLADDAMDEGLDRSEAGDATAARRPRCQPMPSEGGGDLVEPLAMLHQRASDVSHRTVPRWSCELGTNGIEYRTNLAPASALPPLRPMAYRTGTFCPGRRPIRGRP